MGKCGKTIGTGSKLIENFNLSRQLDDILGEERDYTCTNGFKPGLFWEIGWNWIRGSIYSTPTLNGNACNLDDQSEVEFLRF
ncbi:uncharacterized protein LOC123305976 isoform X2 [Chrysoperla carnea]|uniref:uncharacterized protein LOC123305976 isoform X2 n=1 Tax=Chrysoperla carnea TaxID=189513 RepID=UPI001D07C785|nr:uncharacterized protein LOC123305976 isoform X2 [Chrysoperla carnea]